MILVLYFSIECFFVILVFGFKFIYFLSPGNYRWEVDMPCCSGQPSRLCKFYLILIFFSFVRVLISELHVHWFYLV